MKAWIYQEPRQVKKYGSAKASWYVAWYDPRGRQRCKSCGPGRTGLKNAERKKRHIEATLAAGVYDESEHRGWDDFRREYEKVILSRKKANTQDHYKIALEFFEKLMRPAKLNHIDSKTMSVFVARRYERAKRPLSPATINKDLRHLRAVLHVALSWGYIRAVPKMPFQREPKRIPTYVPAEDFAKLYVACDHAKEPRGLLNGVTPVAWWRAFFVFAFMTGWRVGSILELRWRYVSLRDRTVLSPAEHNKDGEDCHIQVHDLVVQHLEAIQGGDKEKVFVWPTSRRVVYDQFRALQKLAGVKPTRRKERFGFHDFRRSFATYNAEKLPPLTLQKLMGHETFETTMRYIEMAKQLRPGLVQLFVPPTSLEKPEGETAS